MSVIRNSASDPFESLIYASEQRVHENAMQRDGESITRVEAFGTRDKRVGRASQIEIERAMVKVNAPLGSTGLLPSSINDETINATKGAISSIAWRFHDATSVHRFTRPTPASKRRKFRGTTSRRETTRRKRRSGRKRKGRPLRAVT